MERQELKRIVEALIFAADEPLSVERILETIEIKNGVDLAAVIDELNREYQQSGRAFLIRQVAGGYQIATRPDYSSWIRKLYLGRHKTRLSQAALETLAIIAFKQPISRVEIAQIRGVNSDGVIGTLLERRLVTISGRAEGVGRPLLYSTTPEFLKYFGLNELADLPKPREIEELFGKEGMPEEIVQALSQTEAQLSLPMHSEEEILSPGDEATPKKSKGDKTKADNQGKPAELSGLDRDEIAPEKLTASVEELFEATGTQRAIVTEIDNSPTVVEKDEVLNHSLFASNLASSELIADPAEEVDSWLAEEFSQEDIAEPEILLKAEALLSEELQPAPLAVPGAADVDGKFSAAVNGKLASAPRLSPLPLPDEIFQQADDESSPSASEPPLENVMAGEPASDEQTSELLAVATIEEIEAEALHTATEVVDEDSSQDQSRCFCHRRSRMNAKFLKRRSH
ncbi:MAG: SMC-Scp complex subunit ScpB [candidate division KSB1 bacterium]|nr:SMC-Scp complex subunit ScpB [candidate division KSB1 bacterium]